MVDAEFARERRLFDAAWSLLPTERAAFLQAECADDPALRARVESLLQAAPLPTDVLTTLEPSIAARPERIGPYTILGVLGEGGMGTVYLAEQLQPLRRRVALKVIKLGMDSKAVLARFAAERQSLAVMNHDGIAKILDAGATDSGQPYFAMELVEGGRPLTTYCNENALDLRQRIALFEQVCHAVQHAHQKGVVHRDLTPGNVLVAGAADKPVAKIIDFGVARATERSEGATTVTSPGIGTPEYMAPEQAGGDARLIDTRTDVYALGTMLYELLCGELPFAGLRMLSPLERERRLRSEEPASPSARLGVSGPRASAHAQRCRTDAETLRRALRGEPDWIVLKAIAKEPEDRYQTAHDLALDLRRHLADEPVAAGPPTTGYRMRKLVRRYRTQVAAGLTVVATALGGAVIAVAYAVEANAQRTEADQQRTAAERAHAENEAKLGRLAANDGRHAEALACYERAQQLGIADAVTLDIWRYEALDALGRTAEAAALLAKLPTAGPGAAKVALLRAAATEWGKPHAARTWHELSEQFGPQFDGADRLFVEAMSATDLDTIHARLRAALELDPQHAASLRALGPILLFRGELHAALGVAEDLRLLLPHRAEHAQLRALALLGLGRFDEAREYLAREASDSDTITLFQTMGSLFELLEEQLDEKVRTNARDLIARTPNPPPWPGSAEGSRDWNVLKRLAPRALLLAGALAKLDVPRRSDRVMALTFHHWASERYTPAKLTETFTHLLCGDPVAACETLPEAVLMLARDSVQRRIGPRPLRGCTAALPAVRRADAQLAVALATTATDRMRAIGTALALALTEEELLSYLLLAMECASPTGLLVDRVFLRWNELHGETQHWRLASVEVQAARGAQAAARAQLETIAAEQPDDPWVRSLQHRLSR
jgi:serine/threonine protein kinase